MTAPKPKIVVHVPHAALVIPDEARADFLLPWPEVEAEAFELEVEVSASRLIAYQ